MRIAFIISEFSETGGGIATFYRSAIPEFRRQLNVKLVVGSNFNLNETGNDAADLIAQLSPGVVRHWFGKFEHLAATPTLRRMLAAAWAAWDCARQSGPFDIIETADFGLLHIPHALCPLAPTIMQAHGSWGQIGLHERSFGQELDQGLALALETEAMRHLSARHSSSEMNAKWWEGQGAGQFRVIRACLPFMMDDKVGREIDQVLRVFGRIQAWKGPAVVGEAWTNATDLPNIEWYGRDVALDIRGGSTRAMLQSAYPNVWGGRIRSHGLVSPDKVAQLQARALLNLVPSTWDVFNFTAAEAMASGRPVLCSNRAGASELIEDGRTGFVYDGTAPNELISTVRRALSLGPERLAKIGVEARASIRATLDTERQTSLYIAAYKDAIASPRPDPMAIPTWFREVALPRDPSIVTDHYLYQHPFRKLAAHLFKRTLRKIRI